MKKKASEKNLNIEVYSSGTYAVTNDGPTREAIEVMEEMDIDIHNHRAINIINSNINEMDIILCATDIHKMQVIGMFPALQSKVFTIKEFAYGVKEDVKDPFGYNRNVYAKCAKELEEAIDKIIEKL